MISLFIAINVLRIKLELPWNFKTTVTFFFCSNTLCASLDQVHRNNVQFVGRTALHVAAEHGHASNLSVLVESGASMTIRDHLGLTALDVAEKADHEECMIVLRKYILGLLAKKK